jgi:hypothetical protein
MKSHGRTRGNLRIFKGLERATVVDTGLKTKLSAEIVADSYEGLGSS